MQDFCDRRRRFTAWCPTRMMRSYLFLAVLFVTGAMLVEIDYNTVYINQFEGVLSVTDTESVVTLPCNYTSAVKEYPMIRWFRQEEGLRRLIAEIDKNNQFVPYGEFAGRVERGDRGDLLISGPTVNDSGLYICYLDITGTGSYYAKGPVRLNVTHSSGVLHSPDTGNVDDATWKVAPLILVILGWVLAVTCGVFLTIEYMISSSLHANVKRTQSRDGIRSLVIFGVRMGVFILSMGSLVVSTVFSVNPMMLPEHASRVALSTAVITLIAMTVFVVIPFFIFIKNHVKNHLGDTDSGKEQRPDTGLLDDVGDGQVGLDETNGTAVYDHKGPQERSIATASTEVTEPFLAGKENAFSSPSKSTAAFVTDERKDAEYDVYH